MNLELLPLFIHIPLFRVNIYFEFQVYIFSNGREMIKMSTFLHDNDNANMNIYFEFQVYTCMFSNGRDMRKMSPFLHDNNNANTIATPRIFSKSSRVKNQDKKTSGP